MASIVGRPSGASAPGQARTGHEWGRIWATIWTPGPNPSNVGRGARGIISGHGAWRRRAGGMVRGDAVTAARLMSYPGVLKDHMRDAQNSGSYVRHLWGCRRAAGSASGVAAIAPWAIRRIARSLLTDSPHPIKGTPHAARLRQKSQRQRI